MCTYGQAILEEGREQGREQGIEIGEKRGIKKGIEIGEEQCRGKERRQLLLNMLKNGMPVEQASAWTNVPVEYVRKLAEEIKK